MSVTRELRRRVRAETALPRYEPSLPRSAKQPPVGPGWIYEIRHNGFRIIAYRKSGRVRLLTRNGYDFADRFPLIVEAVAGIPGKSCIVDGEAIACDETGLSVFELIRWRQNDHGVTLSAFDLLELDDDDLRREPLEVRKATLKGLLRRPRPGIAFNRHFEVRGTIVYEQACALGCEGVVSKRLGSPYRPGRSDCWIKVKNPAAPAATREAEEDWS